MSPTFYFHKVTKVYGRHTALSDFSLSGYPGQIVALIGENGAGKTTAIRILLGLTAPDDGAACVELLVSPEHGDEIRRRVGYVPDRPALYEWMTCDELGWFAAGFYPRGYRDRYREFLRKYDVPLDRKIKHLSKGMQAKVSLALAIANEPPLLVLDEPTSGLDPLVRREVLESMVDFVGQGRCVLLSSHQIAEVERVADVIAVIRSGKLVLCETLEDLKQSACELIVTTDAQLDAQPVIPGGAEILTAERDQRQWRVLVKHLTEEALAELRGRPGWSSVERRHPSLEEIVVRYMGVKPDDTPVTPAPVTEVLQ